MNLTQKVLIIEWGRKRKKMMQLLRWGTERADCAINYDNELGYSNLKKAEQKRVKLILRKRLMIMLEMWTWLSGNV